MEVLRNSFEFLRISIDCRVVVALSSSRRCRVIVVGASSSFRLNARKYAGKRAGQAGGRQARQAGGGAGSTEMCR